MLIDTHCHLNDLNAYPDPAAEVELAVSAGVEQMIVVGLQPNEWEQTVVMAETFPPLMCILGWHPNYTADYDPAQIGLLETLLSRPKVVALGEIGLDYYRDHSPRERQVQALMDQLELGLRLDLPIAFHAREAYSDLLDILETRPGGRYLLHCFAGNAEDAARAVALGAYFGVDGPITYKKADDLRGIVASLPKDRIVVETDAPYLSPVPHRGKPNRPAYVVEVAKALAETLGMDYEACAAQTTANAQRFFRLATAETS